MFADIQVETTAEEFVVKHGGGDTVAPANLTLTTTGAAEGTVALDQFTATSNSFTPGEEIEIPTDEFDWVADNEWLLGEFGVAVAHEPTNSVFASNRGAVAIERLSVDAETADDDVSALAGNGDPGASASTVSLAVTASTNGPTTGVITHMLDRDNIDVRPSDRLQRLDFAETEREVTVDIENSVSITVNFNGVSTGADLLTGEWAELALDVPETLEFGAQESGEYAVEATYDLYDSETVAGAARVAANSSVVEIDGTNIVAVGSGTTEVTATYTDDEAGRLQTTETVTVEVPVESINLTVSTPLEIGETAGYEVTATFESGRTEDITDKANVTSDDSIITVDEQAAEIEAVGEGNATLTAEYRSVKYLGVKWFENSRQLLAGIARSQVRWTVSNAHHGNLRFPSDPVALCPSPVENSSKVSVTDETEEGLLEYLQNLGTGTGGVFVEKVDGERVALSEGQAFSDVFGNLDDIQSGDDAFVAWAVDNVSETATSVYDASTMLWFSEDNKLDDTGYYARAATGFGTPQPWQGDVTLTNLSADSDGITTEWST